MHTTEPPSNNLPPQTSASACISGLRFGAETADWSHALVCTSAASDCWATKRGQIAIQQDDQLPSGHPDFTQRDKVAESGQATVYISRVPLPCASHGNWLSLLCYDSRKRAQSCLTVSVNATISDLKKLISRDLCSQADDQNYLLIKNSKVLSLPANTRLADAGLRTFDTISFHASRTQLTGGMKKVIENIDDQHRRAPEA